MLAEEEVQRCLREWRFWRRSRARGERGAGGGTTNPYEDGDRDASEGRVTEVLADVECWWRSRVCGERGAGVEGWRRSRAC